MSNLEAPQHISYSMEGLITAVIQDESTREVLMVGYMNEAALARTVESGDVWFWSRSRKALWHKGETSGNYLRATEIRADCDGDALLVLAAPAGPTCHTGARSCFDGGVGGERRGEAQKEKEAHAAVLDDLFVVIEGRRHDRPEGAYTTYLFDKGLDKICKKIGEEATEVVIAAKNAAPDEIRYEVADLFYHALVLLAATETAPVEVWEELRRREGHVPRRR